MRRSLWLPALTLATAALVACANGVANTLDPLDPIDPEDPTTPAEAGTTTPPRDAALPPVVQPDTSPPPTPDATPPADAGTPDTSPPSDGGTGDGGTGDGGTDAGPPTGCASPNACLGATIMAGVSGDTGAQTARATGSTSQWLKVRVSENDSSVIGAALTMRATLTSPASANFDMRLYLPSDGSSQKCTSPDRSTSATVGNDVASLSWGEGAIANGDDDDRTITIEVFHVSGTCSAGQTWSLLVEGNK